MIALVEPLLDKLTEMIASGQSNPLKHGRSLYGDPSDIERLNHLIVAAQPLDGVPMVDLFPMQSVGTDSRLRSLSETFRRRPFVLVIQENIPSGPSLEQLMGELPSILLDSNGMVKSQSRPLRDANTQLQECAQLLPEGSEFIRVREGIVGMQLTEAAASSLRTPPKGRRYVLVDETAVDAWFDIKRLLQDTTFGLELAYHMGYALTSGYARPLEEEGFLVGNNTAYVIACFLQDIFDQKELYVIDRIGAFPDLSHLRLSGYAEQLRGKRFVLVEDVTSTGREIDLLTLSALFLGATATRVVAAFDMEIAASLLQGASSVVCLARPAMRIAYGRVSRLAQIVEGKEP